jgi:putative transposase
MIPERTDSLARTIREAHSEYSRYVNTKYGFVGHVWQGRFKSFPMDGDYCINAVRYVLQNPIRAGMVEIAEDYLWSSAAARCKLRDDSLIAPSYILTAEISNWSEWLRVEDSKSNDLIRRHTRTGRPLAHEKFLRSLEDRTGRKLLPQKRGRRSAAQLATSSPKADHNEDVES